MDFITGLPSSSGKTVIWVVVDRLSKFAHFIALPTTVTAPTLATVFLTEIYRLHGVPKTIVSDRDKLFISQFWRALFKALGTTLAFSSSYHPQTDGQTEVLNRCLETYLRCFVCDQPHHWTRFLHLAEFWYNSSYHSAIGMSPFKALYGRSPPSLSGYSPPATKIDSLNALLGQRALILKTLKFNLTQARQRMVQLANTHRLDKEFAEGDWVYLKLQPYRQLSVFRRSSQKLSRRFFGPFQILRRVGKVAYHLDLPSEARIHPVFHVSLLKKCNGPPTAAIAALPAHNTPVNPDLQPAKILATRCVPVQDGVLDQVLVQWHGQTDLEATWEDRTAVGSLFPSFHLEDKNGPKGEGTDTSYVEWSEELLDPAINNPIGSSPEKQRPRRQVKMPARYLH